MSVTLLPIRFHDHPLLWTIEDIYSSEECAAVIDSVGNWERKLAFGEAHVRNQDRILRDDLEFSKDLFTRIENYLPETMGNLRLVGLNERLRFYRYREGQNFSPHMDHWYQANESRVSLLSVLVYFNSDFEGGETRFTRQIEKVIYPEPGLAAIFQHKIRHEGCPVTSGIKYAMRTDVMYEAPGTVEIQLI